MTFDRTITLVLLERRAPAAPPSSLVEELRSAPRIQARGAPAVLPPASSDLTARTIAAELGD